MKAHMENGLVVAKFLEKDARVVRTVHPGKMAIIKNISQVCPLSLLICGGHALQVNFFVWTYWTCIHGLFNCLNTANQGILYGCLTLWSPQQG